MAILLDSIQKQKNRIQGVITGARIFTGEKMKFAGFFEKVSTFARAHEA